MSNALSAEGIMKSLGEVLVIIPARGGSKSIPRKNIMPILGKPMIAWTIEHALSAKHVSRVIVSTDDKAIAYVAEAYGAEVPFLRSTDLAEDWSRDIDFHQHALGWLEENERYIPDMVVNLRPTTPSRDPDVIDLAIEEFASRSDIDSLRSIHLADQSPYKMWTIDDRGFMQPVAQLAGICEPYNEPRQKLPLVYWQDGYIDITRPSVIWEQNSTTGKVIFPFVIQDPSLDIDYPDQISETEAQLRERRCTAGDQARLGYSKRHPS